MPATRFICPDGTEIPVFKCFNQCPYVVRCMFLPTLRAVAASLDRKLDKATVTELLCGVRETYLKKTTDYAVDPMQQLYAIHGSAVHTIHESYADGNMLSEERLADEITSGKFDLYGQIVDYSDKTLGDYKVTSSYKLMRALGYYKVDVATGEVYKTGLRKGQAKTRKEWRTDGVKHLLDWAVQLNYYRILLEERGFVVADMRIQAMCRDYNLRIANERNIRKPVYIIRINKISDHWIKLYMSAKAKLLDDALAKGYLPKLCSAKERWHDRKCKEYCAVAANCPYGRMVKGVQQIAA
ncbi:MAG: hypothetical protein Q4E64_08045 [Phascolarctobacterium sp.]|uniref:hypothetical protein n=1 Tax=Phascolarctobacterium sp. TaxID=2049039 RepID=UPI0026DAEB3B|nr:hypothetical protein [Phascolarctobacterium sp.]MDO4921760.1 hypothetical protein [Phascolarctobacterium sp.]